MNATDIEARLLPITEVLAGFEKRMPSQIIQAAYLFDEAFKRIESNWDGVVIGNEDRPGRSFITKGSLPILATGYMRKAVVQYKRQIFIGTTLGTAVLFEYQSVEQARMLIGSYLPEPLRSSYSPQGHSLDVGLEPGCYCDCVRRLLIHAPLL